jgi:hypothetical protein
MTNKHFGWLVLALLAGCTTVRAGGQETSATLCEQAGSWDSAAPEGTVRIPPSDTSEEGGRTYRFDLAGRGGLRTMEAECGWAPYSECAFRVTRADGRQYAFSDLSTFGLWEHQGALYLLYRIVDPKTDADAGKRRIMEVGDPPTEVCNQIGDYSSLM